MVLNTSLFCRFITDWSVDIWHDPIWLVSWYLTWPYLIGRLISDMILSDWSVDIWHDPIWLVSWYLTWPYLIGQLISDMTLSDWPVDIWHDPIWLVSWYLTWPYLIGQLISDMTLYRIALDVSVSPKKSSRQLVLIRLMCLGRGDKSCDIEWKYR